MEARRQCALCGREPSTFLHMTGGELATLSWGRAERERTRDLRMATLVTHIRTQVWGKQPPNDPYVVLGWIRTTAETASEHSRNFWREMADVFVPERGH